MKKERRRVLRGLAAGTIFLFLWLAVVGCSSSGTEETFRVGVIPAQNKGDMQKAMDKLEKVLSDRIGKPVEITVYADYQGVVEAMKYNKLEMAFRPPDLCPGPGEDRRPGDRHPAHRRETVLPFLSDRAEGFPLPLHR